MESKEVLIAESIIASRRLTIRQEEIEKLVSELIIANKELFFQNEEKLKRAAELIIANKELAFQNEEKGKRADELIIANKELLFQHEEKGKRAAELVIANKELLFQHEEKEKRAAELVIANKELAIQNEEKGKRITELIIANKLNTDKDKFLSIIAHDLRSPFHGFLGLTQEMAEEFPRLKKDEMHEIAVGMRDSASNLYRLIENLLQWARIQQGLMPFNPEVVQLLPIVDVSIAMALASAQSKGIEIACNIPDGMEVFVEKNMLQTVIRNLVSNAVKFTLKGGKITLSAKRSADKSVEISVKDTGIGMSHKIVDNIFRIDVKTNRKGTDGEPSTGIGLLLCKEFVEKHGGRIWVESEEDRGSTFHFTIPCNTNPKVSV